MNNVKYEINNNGIDYVGIEIKDNILTVYLPLGYYYEKGSEQSQEFKNEIRKLMNLVAKKARNDIQETNKDDVNFDFIGAMKVLNNYYNYGLYKQKQLKRKNNFKGRINWQRTIHQNQIYLKDKIIYNNVVNEYIDYECEREIQAIQEFCLYKISDTIGFLMDFAYPKNINKFTKREMIDILKNELKNTNEDIKIEMLNNLLTFIKYTDFKAIEKGNFAIKYKEFEYIYQNLVDCYGINASKKEKYNPKAMYCLWENNDIIDTPSPSYPDTIINIDNEFVEYNNIVYILDAKYKKTEKYYRELRGFPNEYEIFKQIRYKIYLENKLKEEGQVNRKIINAFILPQNLKDDVVKIENFYARSEDYPNERIYVVYVDTKKLILDTKDTMKQVLEKLNCIS